MSNPAELIPDLIADLRLYAPSEGGRTKPIWTNFRCPCAVSNGKPEMLHTSQLLFGSEPINPGESRQVGFAFLTTEGADAIRRAGTFYLWDGRIFAEATIVR